MKHGELEDPGVETENRISNLLDLVDKHLVSAAQKATVTDYIRLVQAAKETQANRPLDIRVQWIETQTDLS